MPQCYNLYFIINKECISFSETKGSLFKTASVSMVILLIFTLEDTLTWLSNHSDLINVYVH